MVTQGLKRGIPRGGIHRSAGGKATAQCGEEKSAKGHHCSAPYQLPVPPACWFEANLIRKKGRIETNLVQFYEI
ncbi:hypothetical protein NBRC116598_21760 [Pseudophaeobacter arcticus]|uniref:Uncharacterized protein n=1 Tax=Pseudophaeobacter arcticus TaxID=385492 RepID=A0ABQ0ALJ1_9RHOB